jgi:hypothetical protein
LEHFSPPQPDEPRLALYSPAALVGFSTLFSPLAGGILAFHSLRSAGQAASARHALWMSIGFAACLVVLGQLLPRVPGMGLGLGCAWGSWLSQYQKKRVPDEASYPRKRIGKPLLICLGLTLALLAGIYTVFGSFN